MLLQQERELVQSYGAQDAGKRADNRHIGQYQRFQPQGRPAMP